MLFWIIAGFLLGAGALYLRRHPAIKLMWFDWLLLLVAIIFFMLAIENYNGSMSELEPRAAAVLLASFGIPGLILTAIVAVRAWRGMQKVGAGASAKA
ncbi:MAG: hypothetical protein J0L63_05755 [Anaerolineae bacterium]|nr:hypothetical protein [Anaerolineae bacterium]MBN8618388.1 hypothetical protein [Anaerolineae bacterium]